MGAYSVRVAADSLERLRDLAGFDLDLHGRATRAADGGKFVASAIADDEQIQRLRQAGYEVEIVEDMVATEAQRRLEMAGALLAARALGPADLAARIEAGYLTVPEVDEALKKLASDNPSLVSLIRLPHRSWEGRACYAVRLRESKFRARIGVMFTGGMHAREWGGVDTCIAFLVRLIAAYHARSGLVLGGKSFTPEQIQAIFRHLYVVVLPDVNPDGRHYSQTASMWWRKNRNPNASSNPAQYGVDLNRNFDFLWQSGIGTAPDAGDQVYRGSAPFSEPETCNVRFLLDRFPGIRYFLDLHSFSGLILYPWGDDDNQSARPLENFRNAAYDGLRGTPGGYAEYITADDRRRLEEIANRLSAALTAVRGTRYSVQQSVGLYPTSATSVDYAYSRHIAKPGRAKVYPFTIEFGTEFIPPFAEMQKISQELTAAMVELCLAAIP